MNYKDKFVGIKLYGHCNGYFGRDTDYDKTIIASGRHWIVTQNENGRNEFASFDEDDDMESLINEWSEEDEE